MCIHLKLLHRTVSGAWFLTGGDLSVSLFIVDLWQYCVFCIRSGVIQCTLLMVLYLNCMCQCGLHAVCTLVAHQYTYAPPHCRTSQNCRTFIPLSVSFWNDLLTLYSIVWDWQVSRVGPMLSCWPKRLYPYKSLLQFLFFSSFCL